MIADLPLWAALVVAVLVLAGAALALIGAIGLVRAQTFYARAHPPTLGSTFGMTCVLLASLVYFSVTGLRASVHELLLIFFVPLVAPVTMMLLARAALFRDRSRGYDEELAAAASRAADALARAREEAARHPGPSAPAPPEPEPPR